MVVHWYIWHSIRLLTQAFCILDQYYTQWQAQLCHASCRRSDEEYDRLTEPLREHNAQLMAAARHQHDLALQQWQKQYQLAVMEWESMQVGQSCT